MKRDNCTLMEVKNAKDIVNYWERNKEDSEIYLQYVDFNVIELYISDDYTGTIDDTKQYVKDIIFNAHI